METDGSSPDRILFLLKTRGAQTASVLAAALKITPMAVRQHLSRLQTDGLVDYCDERRSVGRPKRHWRLTEKAQARFPDSHAQMTVELLRAARAVFGETGVDRLIAEREKETLAQYRARLGRARGLAARVRRLAELRSEEGYMAECVAEPGGRFLLIENHCPVCAAAASCQGLCRSEMAIFQAVLGPDATVDRIDHLLAGARRCAYRIAPADASPTRTRRSQQSMARRT